MDLLYTVSRKLNNSAINPIKQFESVTSGCSLCTISNQNLLAFTTVTTVTDTTANSWGSHVCVADLNSPWQAYKITSNLCSITVLEWDLVGENLVVADTNGVVQIWGMKDHILNDWVCLGNATFHGEKILSAAFFHNGRKTSLVYEKKDNFQYSEKFSHHRVAPSVKSFGGRPLEGCLVVSATGMVGVIVLLKDAQNITLQSVSESLGAVRNRITSADICYGKNGQFLIAVSSGNVKMPIQCYRVSVKKNDDKCVIMSQALPSFFLQDIPVKESSCRKIVDLKFVVKEDTDSLVVAANGESGSIIEIWELREKPLPIHKLFQPKHSAPVEPLKTVLWQHQSQFRATSQILCVTTSKLSITSNVPPPSYIIVAFADGTIHCLFRESLKQVSTTNINNAFRNDDPTMAKHQKLSVKVSKMDISWLGNVLMCIDTHGQLYLYRLTPISEHGGPITVPYACTLLEYCLVTGLDWWDLLVSLRSSMLEAVVEKFTESFNRQNSASKQFYYVQFLCIKTSLYRIAANGQTKAADLTSLLMLYSIATAFKSLLRPSDMSNHDKGPAESLAAVLTDPVTDVDKVLLHLEAKEFTVEPSTLQSLQQLIQWIADLTLNLLARLPEQRQTSNKSSGYQLTRDYQALSTLRELLVIIRIWGLLCQSCLPVFVGSVENFDVLPLLFRLLSRLIQTSESDESLLDECCSLPNQVAIPQMNFCNTTTQVLSPALFTQILPMQLYYGVEPDFLEYIPDKIQIENGYQSELLIDSFRHVFLGKQPLTLKQCSR
ncbi:hypothetical protein RUM43_013090 [Polyplax serrata]|uniref:Mediator of RNA polymerase II transcription subunit 16 n=1 Tax=Polyplax serrata TaxID=468196 RepID=A0AAN8P206_POLSC